MSEGIEQIWIQGVERPLLKLNLLFSPTKRAVVFGLGTAIALWTFKPSGLFTEEGEPKNLRMAGKVVPIHWTTTSLFIALVPVLFI